MNPFILSIEDNLAEWKKFRNSLPNFSEEEQLSKVAQYWALAPLSRFAYDMEKPKTWLAPWEMLAENSWCRNSVAIGMEFTLRLSGWDSSRLQIANIKDYDLSDQFSIVIIDDSKVLNYSYSEVVDYPTTKHDVIDRWRFSGRFYSQITV